MENGKLSRRRFLERAAVVGAATFGVSLLAACEPKDSGSAKDAPKGDTPKGDAPKAAPKAEAKGCNDVSALSDAEKATRDGLKYVDISSDKAKQCKDCALFTAGAPCGSCSVVKGPINPLGTCLSFAKKA